MLNPSPASNDSVPWWSRLIRGTWCTTAARTQSHVSITWYVPLLRVLRLTSPFILGLTFIHLFLFPSLFPFPFFLQRQLTSDSCSRATHSLISLVKHPFSPGLFRNALTCLSHRDTMASEASIALTNRSLRNIRTVRDPELIPSQSIPLGISINIVNRNLNFLPIAPSSLQNTCPPSSHNFPPKPPYMLLYRFLQMSQPTPPSINFQT